MHAGVRVRALFPTGPAPEVRQRPQGIRSQQCRQDPQRAQRYAAGRRRELAGLRSGGTPP